MDSDTARMGMRRRRLADTDTTPCIDRDATIHSERSTKREGKLMGPIAFAIFVGICVFLLHDGVNEGPMGDGCATCTTDGGRVWRTATILDESVRYTTNEGSDLATR